MVFYESCGRALAKDQADVLEMRDVVRDLVPQMVGVACA